MGAGAGLGSWYVHEGTAFEEKKQPKVIAFLKKLLPSNSLDKNK
jgi:hypothetical protein